MHRIRTTSTNGETRVIAYESRAAALKHFGSIASSRHTTEANLEKQTTITLMGEPQDGPWVIVASMRITEGAF